MPSKSRKAACRRRANLDPDLLSEQLLSPDPELRLAALHRLCPCGAGFRLYERFLAQIKQLQRDPDPRVREMALHVEHDACEIELIESRLDTAAELGRRVGDAGWTKRKQERHATRTWEPAGRR